MNENELRPKSSGRALHVSGFACDCHDFMKPTINDTVKKSFKIITPGKNNNDGYWCNSDLAAQIEDISDLVKFLHPGCVIVFIFDNSQNHHARRPDALWAANLNLSDGGKNIKPLRNTTWNGVVQLI